MADTETWEDYTPSIPAASTQEVWQDFTPSKPLTPVEGATAQTLNVLNGLTLGGGDKLAYGGSALLDYLTNNSANKSLSDLYSERKALGQDLTKRFSEQAPTLSEVGSIAGSLAVPIPGLGVAGTGVKAAIKSAVKGASIFSAMNAAQNFLSKDGTLEERIQAIPEGAGTAAMLGSALGPAEKAIEGIGSFLLNSGKGFKKGALSITASDIKKANKSLSVSDKIAGSDSPLLKSIEAIDKSGTLAKGIDPEVLLPNVLTEINQKNNQVSNLIKGADQLAASTEGAIKTNIPDFSATERYISRLKGSEKETAQKVFDKELSAQVDTLNNGGTLSDWHDAKVSLQGITKYGTDESKLSNDVTKLMASDVKRYIEKSTDKILPKELAGQVRLLNAEVGQRRPLVKILQRNLDNEQAKNPVKSLVSLLRTTGGFGVPILATRQGGGDWSDSIAAGLGGAILTSRGGQYAAGKALTKAGKIAQTLPLGEATRKAGVGLLGLTGSDESKSQSEIKPSPTLQKALDKLAKLNGRRGSDMSTNDTPKQKEEFNAKVKDIADNLDANPEHLMQVMKFETGGTLDSAEKNKAGSGATGLIQFMPSTAKELTKEDTKAAAIKVMESMTPVKQLDYVEKYLAPFKGKLKTLEDMYMAILYPKAVGKDSEFALFKKGTTAYWQNKGLDLDKDGVITKSEAAQKVKSYKA